MTRPMRVRLVLSLTVDADAWADEYGVEDVRADVIAYVSNAVRADLRERGLLVEPQ